MAKRSARTAAAKGLKCGGRRTLPPLSGENTSRFSQVKICGVAKYAKKMGSLAEFGITVGEVNSDGVVFLNLEKDEVQLPPVQLQIPPGDPDFLWNPEVIRRNARMDEWIEASGVDLAMQLGPSNWTMVPLGTRMVAYQGDERSHGYFESTVEQGRSIFEHLTVEQVRSILADPKSRSDYVVSFGTRVSSYPASATYLFKTRRGDVGVLQIAGFTNDLPGVKIRFKLVRNSPP